MNRSTVLTAACIALLTACGGDASTGPTGPGSGGGSGSARFATVRELKPRTDGGTIGRLKPTNDALYFDVNANGAISVWRHYGDTVFASFNGNGRPIANWSPTMLDHEPERQFSIYWMCGQMTADLKELRFGTHSFGPIGVPNLNLWNAQPLIHYVVPTVSTEVTGRQLWGVADWGGIYREDRFIGKDTMTAQWFEPIYTEQEPFPDALAGLAVSAEGYLYIGGMALHEITVNGGYRRITLPGGSQVVTRLIYDGKYLWIGRMLDVLRMPIYPVRGEPTVVATVDGQFCVWGSRIYTSMGSVYTTGVGAKKESWVTDKPLAELTVQEHQKLQALLPTGGFSAFTCSPFTDEPMLYATGMDASFRLTRLFEIVPVR